MSSTRVPLAFLLVAALSAATASADLASCLAGLNWPICGDFCLPGVHVDQGVLFSTVTCTISAQHPNGSAWSGSCSDTVMSPNTRVTEQICIDACDNHYQSCPDPPPPPCPDPPSGHGPEEKLAHLEGAKLREGLDAMEVGDLRLINGVLLWRANPKFSKGQQGIFAVTMGDTGNVKVSSIPARIAMAFDADIWTHPDTLDELHLIGEDLTIRLRKSQVDWAWPEGIRPDLPLTFQVEVLLGFLEETK